MTTERQTYLWALLVPLLILGDYYLHWPIFMFVAGAFFTFTLCFIIFTAVGVILMLNSKKVSDRTNITMAFTRAKSEINWHHYLRYVYLIIPTFTYMVLAGHTYCAWVYGATTVIGLIYQLFIFINRSKFKGAA